MPIYEYQCTECGELKEALQKMSDAPLVDCPACGKAALKKKISAAAFRLKGGGWYETDFKSGNKKNLAGDSGEGRESGKESGKESGGDSKSADGASAGGAKSDSKADSKKTNTSSSAGTSAASS